MRIGLILLFFLCLTVIAFLSAGARGAVDHSIFTNILRDNVTDDGLVDYAALKGKQFDLLVYLDAMANADVNAMTRDEQLAYYINLYNASVLNGICERYHANYSPADNDYELFKAPLVRTGGKTI